VDFDSPIGDWRWIHLRESSAMLNTQPSLLAVIEKRFFSNWWPLIGIEPTANGVSLPEQSLYMLALAQPIYLQIQFSAKSFSAAGASC